MRNYLRATVIPLLVIVLAFGFVGFTETAEADEPVERLILAHGLAVDMEAHFAAERFKELVEERTNGEVQVEIFPAGQLGDIADIIESMRMGSIQTVIETPARLEPYSDLPAIFKVPFLLEGPEHAHALADSEIGRELFDAIADETDVRPTAIAWRGARNITSSVPVYTIEDMEGLSIRVPPYDIPVETFERLGASPTPIDFGELYMALETGVVDAQENSYATIYPEALHEVQDYVIEIEYIGDVHSFLVSVPFLERIDEEYARVIEESARDAMEYMTGLVLENIEQYREDYKDWGVEIIVPEDLDVWREILQDVYYDVHEPYVKAIREMEY